MKIERVWSMPSGDTLSIKPIKKLYYQYYKPNMVVVDPFARYCTLGTITNDLNPSCPTTYHMDALSFMRILQENTIDMLIYDPPYSPRQVTELYASIGKDKLKDVIQNRAYWKDVKDEVARVVKPLGICLCCGWNTNGIGIKRGFTMEEILIVAHGGSHNDTLVTIERKEMTLFDKGLQVSVDKAKESVCYTDTTDTIDTIGRYKGGIIGD